MANTSSPRHSEVHALLPIKNLTGVKSRLGSALSADERLSLVQAMAEDVLTALKATPGLAGIHVVTHDDRVADWARARDLGLIDDAKAKSLPKAITLAAQHMQDSGVEAMMVVLADIPFAAPDDFEALIHAHEAATETPHVILSPSRDGDGSNCLLVAPPTAMTFHYGPGSAEAHASAAARLKLPFSLEKRPGIGHDIDTEKDLFDLIKQIDALPRHSKTRQFLTTSRIAARMTQNKH